MSGADSGSEGSRLARWLPPLGLRLVIWYGLIFTLVVTALLAAWTLVQRPARRDAFDAQLLRAAHEIGRALRTTPAWDEAELHELVAAFRDVLYAEVDGPDGRTIRTANAALATELPPLHSRPERFEVLFDDIDLGGAQQGRDASRFVRHVALTTLDHTAQPVTVHVLARETPDARLLRQFIGELGFLVPAVLIASFIVSALLVRRALGPLGRIARVTRSLRPETLSEPIQIEGAEGDVAELQAALNDARERLDDAFEAQGRFISNVSHELKTPISVLLTQAQVLDPENSPRADFARFRRLVQDEMRRLGKLVESFLVLARSSHGGEVTRKETVPLMDVVLESIQHCSRYAEQCGVRLVPRIELGESEEGPTVRGDPELLRTMLDNLVRNAVRFTPEDQVVEVALIAYPERALLQVTDVGPGLPDGALEALFDPFVQSLDGSRRSGGVGLGLSISANIVSLHEGTISAENGEDGGCTFTIELPLGRAVPQSTQD